MKKILLIILLLLSSYVIADNPPPPPVQTTSISKITDSIIELKNEINALRQGNKELRVQLNKKLDKKYNDLMFFLIFFTISVHSFSKIAGRFYGWIMFKRLKRKTIKFHKKIIEQYAIQQTAAEKLSVSLSALHLSLNRIDSEIKRAMPKLDFKQKQKKKSAIRRFINWLMFWKK